MTFNITERNGSQLYRLSKLRGPLGKRALSGKSYGAAVKQGINQKSEALNTKQYLNPKAQILNVLVI
jgi:hypothetical protein